MFAVAPEVKRNILVCWGLAGSALGLAGVNQHYRFLTHHPYVLEALSQVKRDDPTPLGFYRKGKYLGDDYAHASVAVGNEILHVSARAKAIEATAVGGDDYDEYVIEGTGWRHYLRNPWDVKIAAIKQYRVFKSWMAEGLSGFSFFIGDTLNPGSVNQKRHSTFEVTGIFMEQSDKSLICIKGDPRDHPLLADACTSHYVALSATSKTRLYCFLAAVAAALVAIVGKRQFTSQAKEAAAVVQWFKSHPILTEFFGFKSSIVKTEGFFENNFINGKIHLKSDRGDQAISVEAFRREGVWNISRATLFTGNRKSIPLVI